MVTFPALRGGAPSSVNVERKLPKIEPLILRLLMMAFLVGLGLVFLLPGLVVMLALGFDVASGKPDWARLLASVSVATAFVSAGLFIIRRAGKHWTSQSRRIANQRRYPHEPWRWDQRPESFHAESEPIAIRRMPTTDGWKMLFVLGGIATAVLSLVVVSFVLSVVIRVANDREYSGTLEDMVIPAALLAASATVFSFGVRGRHRAQLRNAIVLRPHASPIWLGTRFSGMLVIPPELQLIEPPRIGCECVHCTIIKSSRYARLHEDNLWQADYVRPPLDTLYRDASYCTIVPVEFDIPATKPSTDEYDSNDYICWCLRLEARFKRLSIEDRFKLPIYARPV